MSLRIYNSLGRKVEAFVPIEPGKVRMYTCGPTVWNYAHIGNLRTFVFDDLLRRYLRFSGFEVTQVMNITDVEDRIIKGMKQFGKSRLALTQFFEKAFMDDLRALNVQTAEFYPKATEYVPEMVRLIKVLLEKGYAYSADDGSTYYRVSKFPDYGSLSGIRQAGAGERAHTQSDSYDKEEAVDFALWKAWTPDDGEVSWQTELGRGRPGWHIECSAMSMKLLGESFDIHTGGLDNRFPHHENEIAQSEAVTGKKFVRYWLHAGLLQVRGADMHKSVGNVVYLKDILTKGWDAMTVRYLLVSSHYREPLDLDDGALARAKAGLDRLQGLMVRLRSLPEGEGTGAFAELADGMLQQVREAMDDDLNSPKALAAMFNFAKEANRRIDDGKAKSGDSAAALRSLEKANEIFGFLRFEARGLTEAQVAMIEERRQARARGDYASADKIRAELLGQGIALRDGPEGTEWYQTRSG